MGIWLALYNIACHWYITLERYAGAPIELSEKNNPFEPRVRDMSTFIRRHNNV